MIPWYFLLTELIVLALAAIALVHAWRQGGLKWTAVFLGSSISGFVLEYLSVKQGEYCYGRFLLMVPPGPCHAAEPCPCPDAVPAWIILGWGVTIYTVMLTASRLDLSPLVRPLFAALLAVNIDWIMDPLAARLGFWTWSEPGPWFGIPLFNYVGWITIVTSFSLTWGLIRRHVPSDWSRWLREIVPAVGATLVTPLAVFAVLGLDGWLTKKGVSWAWILGLALLVAVLLVVPRLLRARGDLPPDWVVIGIGVFFPLFYSAGLWASGLYRQSPLLILVSLAVLAFAVCGYCWPYKLRAADS